MALETAHEYVGEGKALSALTVVDESPSTNLTVREGLTNDPAAWPHMSALATDHQTAGLGRAGRTWTTPAGVALTVSIVVRPEGVLRERFGWVPLIAGLAVTRAVQAAGVDAAIKWPNDVVTRSGGEVSGWGTSLKLAGILCEAVGDAVIVGVGLNVKQSREQLPVPHATSLAIEGAAELDRGRLLGLLANELRSRIDEWSHDGAGAMVAARVAEACITVGQGVVVEVPGREPIAGTAIGISSTGGLLLDTAWGIEEVVAGDVRVRRI